VSPTLPPSRCSQPQGKSTTGAPARAPRCPPSSATANSSSTGHLRLSSPVRHLPKHHRTPGYLTDLSIVVDECSSGPSPALLPAQRALPRIVSSVSPQPPQLLQSGFFHSGVAPHPLPHWPRASGSPESADAADQRHRGQLPYLRGWATSSG
jgi:hypothetical protein